MQACHVVDARGGYFYRASSFRATMRLARIDTIGWLLLAMLLNGAIMVLGVSAFNASGMTTVDDIRTCAPADHADRRGLCRDGVPLALLVSGRSSTLTAAIAGNGKVIMYG